MGLRAFVFGSPGALSLSGLRIRHAVLRDQLDSAESLRQQAETALAALREDAKRAGLAAELRDLENPPPPKSLAREAATVRVIVREGFAVDYQDIVWHATTGEVLDLPGTLATRLQTGGLVERVDQRTPLHRAVIQW
jgi:hypothetical protein